MRSQNNLTKNCLQLRILWAQLSRHIVRLYMWAARLACRTQITSINTSTSQLEALYTALCNHKVTEGTGAEVDWHWESVQYAQKVEHTLLCTRCPLSACTTVGMQTETEAHHRLVFITCGDIALAYIHFHETYPNPNHNTTYRTLT